jgi:hypothetical protein
MQCITFMRRPGSRHQESAALSEALSQSAAYKETGGLTGNGCERCRSSRGGGLVGGHGEDWCEGRVFVSVQRVPVPHGAFISFKSKAMPTLGALSRTQSVFLAEPQPRSSRYQNVGKSRRSIEILAYIAYIKPLLLFLTWRSGFDGGPVASTCW